jgi:hypothetical protein
MADQMQPAQRAHPEIAVHPPPQTGASHSNFSQPPTASDAAVSPPGASPTQGTEAPVATTTPIEDHVNLNARLNAADRYWKFKGALQAVAILMGLIGIGTVGWCVSTWPKSEYAYGFDGLLSLWPCLITFSVSIVWCLACILGLVLRKKGVHPGLRVTVELFLWLGFIVTALLAIAAVLDLSQWGADGDLYGYSSRAGDYRLVSNGTWIWDDTSSSSTTYARDCNGTGSSYYGGYSTDSTPLFSSCDELDAYINKLWKEKPHRYSVELTGAVCQFFGDPPCAVCLGMCRLPPVPQGQGQQRRGEDGGEHCADHDPQRRCRAAARTGACHAGTAVGHARHGLLPVASTGTSGVPNGERVSPRLPGSARLPDSAGLPYSTAAAAVWRGTGSDGKRKWSGRRAKWREECRSEVRLERRGFWLCKCQADEELVVQFDTLFSFTLVSQRPVAVEVRP